MKPNLEKFQKLLKIKTSNSTILVEGKKDEKVLLSLGFKNIIPISNQPLVKIKSKIKTKEVIILTDFDEEGESLRKRIKEFLHFYDFKINESFPRLVRSLGVKKIEELSFYKRLAEYKTE